METSHWAKLGEKLGEDTRESRSHLERSWCSPTSGPGRPVVSHVASDLKLPQGSQRERELQVQQDGEKGLRAGWGSETRYRADSTQLWLQLVHLISERRPSFSAKG